MVLGDDALGSLASRKEPVGLEPVFGFELRLREKFGPFDAVTETLLSSKWK